MRRTFYIPKKERIAYLSLIVLILLSHQINHVFELTVKNSHSSVLSHELSDIAVSDKSVEESTNGSITFKEEVSPNPETVTRSDQNQKQRPANNSSIIPVTQQTEKDFHPNPLSTESVQIAVNPNLASQKELIAIGMTKYSSQNLIKYRSNGGVFRKPSDLLRIYGMDSIQFKSVQPWLIFPEVEKETLISSTISINKESEPAEKLSINLNEAVASDLELLKGIGPVFSKRIIEYREKLGGFYHIDQLEEVYGLPEETLFSIKDHLFLSGNIVKFFPPNKTFKEVLAHPYIDYELTKMIKNIPLADFESKMKTYIDDGFVPGKLIPYLLLTEPGTPSKQAN